MADRQRAIEAGSRAAADGVSTRFELGAGDRAADGGSVGCPDVPAVSSQHYSWLACDAAGLASNSRSRTYPNGETVRKMHSISRPKRVALARGTDPKFERSGRPSNGATARSPTQDRGRTGSSRQIRPLTSRAPRLKRKTSSIDRSRASSPRCSEQALTRRAEADLRRKRLAVVWRTGGTKLSARFSQKRGLRVTALPIRAADP